jgi:ABC-type dipeptide/oligopeptide/nickel transport system permease component
MPPDVPALYAAYLQQALSGDFGAMPQAGAPEPLAEGLARAAGASAGLLALAFVLSVLIGLGLGLASVRVNPPGVAPWLTPFITLGLSVPSFYLGTLFVALAVYLALQGLPDFPLPLSGFGWDAHLVLPTLALMLRPAMQIAQVTATVLADEFHKQYVVTARSVGNTWRTIRWKHALRNIAAAVVQTVAGAFRLSLVELVLVEWLFSWPGLGRLLALTLIAPNIAGPGTIGGGGLYFLDPTLLPALITLFALAFLLADALASAVAHAADPRLRLVDEGGAKVNR